MKLRTEITNDIQEINAIRSGNSVTLPKKTGQNEVVATISYEEKLKAWMWLLEGYSTAVYDDATSKILLPNQPPQGFRTVGIGFNMDRGEDALLEWYVAFWNATTTPSLPPITVEDYRNQPSVQKQKTYFDQYKNTDQGNTLTNKFNQVRNAVLSLTDNEVGILHESITTQARKDLTRGGTTKLTVTQFNQLSVQQQVCLTALVVNGGPGIIGAGTTGAITYALNNPNDPKRWALTKKEIVQESNAGNDFGLAHRRLKDWALFNNQEASTVTMPDSTFWKLIAGQRKQSSSDIKIQVIGPNPNFIPSKDKPSNIGNPRNRDWTAWDAWFQGDIKTTITNTKAKGKYLMGGKKGSVLQFEPQKRGMETVPHHNKRADIDEISELDNVMFSGDEKDDLIGNPTETTYFYANDGDDKTRGGTGDDHHIPGEGNDEMEDKGGFDTYYIDSNEIGGGHKIIDDSDGKGEIQFNGFPISGIPLEDKDNKGKRWVLGEEENGDVFILTRTANGNMDAGGQDLTITVGEELGAKNSITVKNFPFAKGGGLGIYFEQPSDSLFREDLQVITTCKMDDRHIAQLSYERISDKNSANYLHFVAKVYAITPQGNLAKAQQVNQVLDIATNPVNYFGSYNEDLGFRPADMICTNKQLVITYADTSNIVIERFNNEGAKQGSTVIPRFDPSLYFHHAYNVKLSALPNHIVLRRNANNGCSANCEVIDYSHFSLLSREGVLTDISKYFIDDAAITPLPNGNIAVFSQDGQEKEEEYSINFEKINNIIQDSPGDYVRGDLSGKLTTLRTPDGTVGDTVAVSLGGVSRIFSNNPTANSTTGNYYAKVVNRVCEQSVNFKCKFHQIQPLENGGYAVTWRKYSRDYHQFGYRLYDQNDQMIAHVPVESCQFPSSTCITNFFLTPLESKNKDKMNFVATITYNSAAYDEFNNYNEYGERWTSKTYTISRFLTYPVQGNNNQSLIPSIGTNKKDILALTPKNKQNSAYALGNDDEIHVESYGSTVFGGEGSDQVHYYKMTKGKRNKDRLEGGKLRWRRQRSIRRQDDSIAHDYWRDFNVSDPKEQVVLRGYGKVKLKDIVYDKNSNQTMVYLPDRTLTFKGNITEKLPLHIRQEENRPNGGVVFAAVFFPVVFVIITIAATAYLCKHPEKATAIKDKTLELGGKAKDKLIAAKNGIVWVCGKAKDGIVKGGKKFWGGCKSLWNKCFGTGDQQQDVENPQDTMNKEFTMTEIPLDQNKEINQKIIIEEQKNTDQYQPFTGEETPRVEGQNPPPLPPKEGGKTLGKGGNLPDDSVTVLDIEGNEVMVISSNTPPELPKKPEGNILKFELKKKHIPISNSPRVGEVLDNFLLGEFGEKHFCKKEEVKKEEVKREAKNLLLETLAKELDIKSWETQLPFKPASECFEQLVESIESVINSSNSSNLKEEGNLKEDIRQALLQVFDTKQKIQMRN